MEARSFLFRFEILEILETLEMLETLETLEMLEMLGVGRLEMGGRLD